MAKLPSLGQYGPCSCGDGNCPFIEVMTYNSRHRCFPSSSERLWHGPSANGINLPWYSAGQHLWEHPENGCVPVAFRANESEEKLNVYNRNLTTGKDSTEPIWEVEDLDLNMVLGTDSPYKVRTHPPANGYVPVQGPGNLHGTVIQGTEVHPDDWVLRGIIDDIWGGGPGYDDQGGVVPILELRGMNSGQSDQVAEWPYEFCQRYIGEHFDGYNVVLYIPARLTRISNTLLLGTAWRVAFCIQCQSGPASLPQWTEWAGFWEYNDSPVPRPPRAVPGYYSLTVTCGTNLAPRWEPMMFHVPTQHGGLNPGGGSGEEAAGWGALGWELMEPYCPSIVANPEGTRHFLGSARGLRHEDGPIRWTKKPQEGLGFRTGVLDLLAAGLEGDDIVMPVLWDETDPPSPMDGEEPMNINTGITPVFSAFHQHTTVHCNKVYTIDNTNTGEHFTRMDLETNAKPNYFPVKVPNYNDDGPYINILYDGFPGGDEESCVGSGSDCTSSQGLIRCEECGTGQGKDGISYAIAFRRYPGGQAPDCVDIPDFSVICPGYNDAWALVGVSVEACSTSPCGDFPEDGIRDIGFSIAHDIEPAIVPIPVNHYPCWYDGTNLTYWPVHGGSGPPWPCCREGPKSAQEVAFQNQTRNCDEHTILPTGSFALGDNCTRCTYVFAVCECECLNMLISIRARSGCVRSVYYPKFSQHFVNCPCPD